MKRTFRILASALALGATACADTTGPQPSGTLANAFNSVLFGFDNTTSSFSGGPEGGLVAWSPGGRGLQGAGGGGMCGGGLGERPGRQRFARQQHCAHGEWHIGRA